MFIIFVLTSTTTHSLSSLVNYLHIRILIHFLPTPSHVLIVSQQCSPRCNPAHNRRSSRVPSPQNNPRCNLLRSLAHSHRRNRQRSPALSRASSLALSPPDNRPRNQRLSPAHSRASSRVLYPHNNHQRNPTPYSLSLYFHPTPRTRSRHTFTTYSLSSTFVSSPPRLMSL